MNVEQFAKELKLPIELLLEQLRSAGVIKSTAGDVVTEQDKSRLLDYLSKKHGAQEGKGKITLTRRENTELRRPDSSTGKSRTIQVEVRKKRVLIKREGTVSEPEKLELSPQVDMGAVEAENMETPSGVEMVSETPSIGVELAEEEACAVMISSVESSTPSQLPWRAPHGPALSRQQPSERTRKA